MADDDLLSADKKVKLWRQFFSECLPADKEVKLWRQFFAECLLVYGEKNGAFKDLLVKAIDRATLGHDKILLRVAMLKAIEEHEGGRRPDNVSGPFRVGDFFRACDETAKKKWRQTYNESRIVLHYLSLIDPLDGPPMDRREAIEEVTKEFSFPSFNACFKFLQRAGVPNLPSTWPEADSDKSI